MAQRTKHGQAAIEWGAPTAGRLRAQAAIEVFSYAAFFLLIFVATAAIFFQQQSQGITRAENAYAQEIADGFADRIHTAFVAGSGFSQEFSIPSNILGRPYLLQVSAAPGPATTETGFIYVVWQGSSGEASLSAPTITTDYRATEFQDFIKVSATTGRITIDASKGQGICMRNANGAIIIGKSPCN